MYLLKKDVDSFKKKIEHLKSNPNEIANIFWDFVVAYPYVKKNHFAQFVLGVEERDLVDFIYDHLKMQLGITDYSKNDCDLTSGEFVENESVRSRIRAIVAEGFKILLENEQLVKLETSRGEILLFDVDEKSNREDFQRAYLEAQNQFRTLPAKYRSNNNNIRKKIDRQTPKPQSSSLPHSSEGQNERSNVRGESVRIPERTNYSNPNQQSTVTMNEGQKNGQRPNKSRKHNFQLLFDPNNATINPRTGKPRTPDEHKQHAYYVRNKLNKILSETQTSSASTRLGEGFQTPRETTQISTATLPSSSKRTLESDSFTSQQKDKRTRSISERLGVLQQQSNPTLNTPVDSATTMRTGTASSNGLFSQVPVLPSITELVSHLEGGQATNSAIKSSLLSAIQYEGITHSFFQTLEVRKLIENPSTGSTLTELETPNQSRPQP